MSTPIRIEGPPVKEVTPEQVAEALEEFSGRYLCDPLTGPYPGLDYCAHFGVMWTVCLLGDDPAKPYELHQVAADMLAESPKPAES